MAKTKDKFYWNRKDTAELFGVSIMTLDQWVVRDCPVEVVKLKGMKKPQKRYYIPDIIEWKSNRSVSNVKQLSLEKERTRLAKEQADGQSLKNAVTRKELAPIKLLEISLSEMAVMICSKLESIPLKVKKNLPKLSSAEIEIITREINKALNEASKQELDFDRAEELLKKSS